MEYQNQMVKEGRFCEKLKIKNKPKFVGVRQRASGKWAAEIKDTSKKIRLWLGTYQTPEEAARAYDEAACLLRGSNTRTNFSTQGYGIATDSPISLKLRNILDRKAESNQSQIQNKSSMISSTFQGAASPNVSAINKIVVMENNFACSSEGKSLFFSDDMFGLDMNLIDGYHTCSMGITPNTWQFDYSWALAQQRINELSIQKDDLSVERQLSNSVYATNDRHVEETREYNHEYDANYHLSHFFCFT